jgi:nucleoid-associated protein YgaU
MREFLKLFEMARPFNFVLFDHNPEQLRINRQAKNMGTSVPTARESSGTRGPAARGNEPTKMTITKARLVGPETKPMCDRLLGWLSPRKMDPIEQGVLQLLSGGFISPVLLVQWGPPAVGFTFQAQLTQVTINYVRVSSVGIPSHATVDLILQEVPSSLSLTNPTSGGRPGRNQHLVTSHETLASIATSAFGNPGAWRAIAEINGIDDPAEIQPGDVIYLPAADELAELSGARP